MSIDPLLTLDDLMTCTQDAYHLLALKLDADVEFASVEKGEQDSSESSFDRNLGQLQVSYKKV